MTAKQQRFVDHYLVSLNSTDAARRAGYKLPNKQGPANLVKPGIEKAIAKARKREADKAEVTVERIVAEYARLAFTDLRDVIRIEGGRVVVSDTATLTADQAASLLEIAETKDGIKVKLTSKQAALDSLARHLGMNADTLKVELAAHPEYGALLAKLTGVLARFPDAAAAVAEALEDE